MVGLRSQLPWFAIKPVTYPEKKAIVIGGGLAGTSLVYALTKKGYDVTLFERNSHIAEESSGNPAGIVMPLITHKNDVVGQLYAAGFEHTLLLIAMLQELGHDVGWHGCGVLDVTPEKLLKDLGQLVVPSADISKISTQEASAIASIDIQQEALHLSRAGWLVPPDLCKAFLALSGDKVKTIVSADVIAIQRDDNNMWSVVVKGSNKVLAHAPVVVVANAKDAVLFSQMRWMPLDAVRGQLTYFPAEMSNIQELSSIIVYEGYVTPAINGEHCVGATFDRADMDVTVRERDHMRNISALKRYVTLDDDIDYSALAGRVAFRTCTPDRRALVGPVPDRQVYLRDYDGLKDGKTGGYPDASYYQGLYVSLGHGSRGLTSCPLAAEYLACLISNQRLPIAEKFVNLWHPGRFIVRKIKQNHKN